MLATVTAFCHCADCCGKAGQPTSSGVMPNRGWTCAGPTNLPFGTWVRFPGIPGPDWRIIEDRMHSRHWAASPPRFDIFVGSHKQAKQFGKRTLRVEIEPPLRCPH